MTVEFGRMVDTYMQTANVSRWDLAAAVGIDRSYISRIIQGAGNLRHDTAMQFAETLNVPAERRAEFLLYAAGHPPEVVETALAGAGGIVVFEREPEEAEVTLTLQRTPKGWRVKEEY